MYIKLESPRGIINLDHCIGIFTASVEDHENVDWARLYVLTIDGREIDIAREDGDYIYPAPESIRASIKANEPIWSWDTYRDGATD